MKFSESLLPSNRYSLCHTEQSIEFVHPLFVIIIISTSSLSRAQFQKSKWLLQCNSSGDEVGQIQDGFQQYGSIMDLFTCNLPKYVSYKNICKLHHVPIHACTATSLYLPITGNTLIQCRLSKSCLMCKPLTVAHCGA